MIRILVFCSLALIRKHSLYNPTKPFRTNSLTRKEPKPYEIKVFIKTPKNLQTSHAFVQHSLLSLYKTIVQFSSKRDFKPLYHYHFQEPRMASGQMKPVASLLLVLNFCMYVVVLGIGGWAMNFAIDNGFVIGKHLVKILMFTKFFVLFITHCVSPGQFARTTTIGLIDNNFHY